MSAAAATTNNMGEQQQQQGAGVDELLPTTMQCMYLCVCVTTIYILTIICSIARQQPQQQAILSTS